MKKIFLVVMMLLAPASYATPPGDVNLTYDLAKGTLTVQGPHPTQEINEHYIRRFEVTKNDEAVKKFYFPRQISPSEYKQTLTVGIKPGDRFHVAVFCSQGGSKEADLVIPEASASEAAPVNLKPIKDQDHQNMQVIP